MKNKRNCLFLIPFMIMAVACNKIDSGEPDTTVLDVELSSDATKTHLGASAGGQRPVYWSEGDQLSLNGTPSVALSGVGEAATSASFTFPGVLNTPFNLLYPASFYKDAGTITIPATQTWVPGGIATNTMPMAGYQATAGAQANISHLGAIVHLQVKKDAGVSASQLASVCFSSGADDQVSGDFSIDYEGKTLTSASSAEADKQLTLAVNQNLSESDVLDVFLVVPARTYESGFKVVLTDEYARSMTKARSSSIDLTPGKLVKMPEFTFVPSPIVTEFSLPNIEEDVVLPDGINVTGRVVDNSGNGLEGVVVSDGTRCVKTMFDGSFYMESDIDEVKFVFVSTPSGYMPPVVGGIPHFYKAKADVTPVGGVYDFGDYVLTPVANPDRYTLLITADPQPRKYSGWNNDRIAFRSLDVCEDLYDELAGVASNISGRQVYGICLGDIVHEDMDLFANYNNGLDRLGFPTYNVIGNHDNNPEAANDDDSAAPYESHYGPRNYSFNIGGIHYVMLDNLIMKKNENNGNKLTGFDQGLTDKIWTWLQNDMAFVPTDTKLMVCAHSPMFKLISSNERSNTAAHAGNDGYGGLLDKYTEVHAWAGHTHVGFNYNYPNNHRHKNIQVHTLARSTGELWTNEYLAAGTPRGFTVVEVDNGDITWKFHPIKRQTGDFVGVTSGICSAGAPAYTWRDWYYNGSGVAVMKDGSGALTEEYQMHVYPRGAYDDNYVYANVFLWDDKWSIPVWTPDDGDPVSMERLTEFAFTYPDPNDPLKVYTDQQIHCYDLGNTEFKSHYKSNVGFFKNDDNYPASEVGEITTIFRAPASASPTSGTVSVTDRFGNTYSRRVSW